MATLLRQIFCQSSNLVQRSYSTSGDSITRIVGRQVYDSRGVPTVEVDVATDIGVYRASVPAGLKPGNYEAVDLRDDDESEFHGKGVSKVIKNINNVLGPKLIAKGIPVPEQVEIDNFLKCQDGENKSNMGANALLGISMAVCRAGAACKRVPLYRHIADINKTKELIIPVPAFNIINGGKHTENKLPLQEYMIFPRGAKCFKEAMKMSSETYHHLKKYLAGKHGTAVGYEGGFASDLKDSREALQCIKTAIDSAGYSGKLDICLDCSATEFYSQGLYNLNYKDPKLKFKKGIAGDKLLEHYKGLINDFPVVSIEDPFEMEDFDSFRSMTTNTNIQVVTDDLTKTNLKRLEKAIDSQAGNCLLLKINQIGTVSEVIEAHQQAYRCGWGTLVSHRTGDTEDPFIADLAVGLATGQIKAGAPCRSERTAKYNQILRIEEEMLQQPCGIARYAGKDFRRPIC